MMVTTVGCTCPLGWAASDHAPSCAVKRYELTDREMSSLAKVASYRALVGKQARQIRELRALLRDIRDNSPEGSMAFELAHAGLEWKP